MVRWAEKDTLRKDGKFILLKKIFFSQWLKSRMSMRREREREKKGQIMRIMTHT